MLPLLRSWRVVRREETSGTQWNASLPAQFVDDALIRPFVEILDQALAKRIFSHGGPLVVIFPRVAEPMMETAPLKFPRLFQMTAAELALPKRNPGVDPEPEIARRTKEMQMVGHEQVEAGQPGGSFFAPDRDERGLHRGLVHPGNTVLGIDGEKEDVRLAEKDVCSRRGHGSPDGRIQRRFFLHAQSKPNRGRNAKR